MSPWARERVRPKIGRTGSLIGVKARWSPGAAGVERPLGCERSVESRTGILMIERGGRGWRMSLREVEDSRRRRACVDILVMATTYGNRGIVSPPLRSRPVRGRQDT